MVGQISSGERISLALNGLLDRIAIFARVSKPALLIGAAVFAYLNQPLMRFIDVYPAYQGAFVATLGLILLSAAIEFRRDLLATLFGVLTLIIGLNWISDGIEIAAKRAVINDQRCLRIETEMLSAQPPRNDLPDIYQALGCRPLTGLYQPLQSQRR